MISRRWRTTFLNKYSNKIGKPIDTIDDRVMARLMDYYWPGNVRELENIIERAVILTDGSRLQLDETFDLTAPPEKVNHEDLRRGRTGNDPVGSARL